MSKQLTQTYNLLTEEDDAALNIAYPERRRGSIPELLKLLWTDPEHKNLNELELVAHTSFVPRTYTFNPAVAMQVAKNSCYAIQLPFEHFHAYRKGEQIHLIAGKHPIHRVKTFIDLVIATLQEPNPKAIQRGQEHYHDFKYDEIPATYKTMPQQLKHRLAKRAHPIHVKVKPYREFLRVWLLPSPKQTS